MVRKLKAQKEALFRKQLSVEKFLSEKLPGFSFQETDEEVLEKLWSESINTSLDVRKARPLVSFHPR